MKIIVSCSPRYTVLGDDSEAWLGMEHQGSLQRDTVDFKHGSLEWIFQLNPLNTRLKDHGKDVYVL